MKNQVIGLNTLKLHSGVVSTGPSFKITAIPAHKKRVFTEDEWKFLNTRPIEELEQRISYGDKIIRLLSRPDMLNMTPGRANMLSSNLRFQQDAIREIIRSRSNG